GAGYFPHSVDGRCAPVFTRSGVGRQRGVGDARAAGQYSKGNSLPPDFIPEPVCEVLTCPCELHSTVMVAQENWERNTETQNSIILLRNLHLWKLTTIRTNG